MATQSLHPPLNPSNPYGTDLALAARSPGGSELLLCYWDLWMLIAAQDKFDGDPDRLAGEMRRRRDDRRDPVPRVGREDWARRLSHLRDLQERLRAAGVDGSSIVAEAGATAQRERLRAWPKVMEKPVRQAEVSPPMACTPAARGMAFALRGLWDRFPVSPAPHADKLASRFKSRGFYSKGQSFGIAHRFDRLIEEAQRLVARGRHTEALAVYRAVLTGIIDVMGCADDSYGTIGDTFQAAFETYLKLPLDGTDMDSVVFLHDLLNLLIWEDYGFTDGRTRGYFRKLSREHGDACIAFLREQIGRLKAQDLDYQAEEALTLLGQVAGEQQRWEIFEPLAREMGARHWERILRLADAAMKVRKRDLAVKVFEAALQPGGMQFDYLLSHFRRLQRGVWKPELRGG